MSVLRTTLLVAGVTWTTSSSDTPCGLSVPTNWAQLGSLQTRTSSQIASSAFSVGAECVDRNYTVYDAWQQHLNPLGSKWARIQAGWERCEPSVGNYDWAWLDEIVTGMMSQGVTPWIQVSTELLCCSIHRASTCRAHAGAYASAADCLPGRMQLPAPFERRAPTSLPRSNHLLPYRIPLLRRLPTVTLRTDPTAATHPLPRSCLIAPRLWPAGARG